MKALEPGRPSRIDLALGLALTALGLLISMGPDGPGGDTWIDTLVVPAVTLPVIWRRRAPLACAAALCAGMVISGIPTFDQTRCGVAIPAALLILYSLATRRDREAAVGGLALVLGGLVFLSFTDASIDPSALSFVLPLCAGVWAAGRVVRERDRLAAELVTRTGQLERRRAQTAQLAVELERTRLAAGLDEASRRGVREIVELTERGAETLDRDPARGVEVFSLIETGGRAALNDMRSLLGVLRSDEPLVRSPGGAIGAQAGPAPPPDRSSRALKPDRLAAAAAVGLGAAWLLAQALEGMDSPSAVILVVIAVSYANGAYASSRLAAAAVGILLACLLVVAGIAGESAVPLIFSTLAPLLVGMAVRSRRLLVSALSARSRELEAEEAAFARLAVRRERTKVARDLHDVIAHSLAVVVVQAGAGRIAVAENGQGRRLADIRAAGLQALAGMDRLGELLGSDDDRIQTLIDGARAAGLRVAAQPLPAGAALPREIDEISFRILQEGLTNALKHAPGTEVDATLLVRDGMLRVEVCDRGAREAVTLHDVGAGLGLAGLSERVTAAGGRLEAGSQADGGWRLYAELPLEGQSVALAR